MKGTINRMPQSMEFPMASSQLLFPLPQQRCSAEKERSSSSMMFGELLLRFNWYCTCDVPTGWEVESLWGGSRVLWLSGKGKNNVKKGRHERILYLHVSSMIYACCVGRQRLGGGCGCCCCCRRRRRCCFLNHLLPGRC